MCNAFPGARKICGFVIGCGDWPRQKKAWRCRILNGVLRLEGWHLKPAKRF